MLFLGNSGNVFLFFLFFSQKRVSADTWVHNLCMLVSQPTGHMDNDRQKLIYFGDALRDIGLVAASHLCYIVANVQFGFHRNTEARMVLLGLEHKYVFQFLLYQIRYDVIMNSDMRLVAYHIKLFFLSFSYY